LPRSFGKRQLSSGLVSLPSSWKALGAARARAATFVDVSEYLTTQTCPDCLAVGGPKGTAGLEIRERACGGCGMVHDRDVAAARNILRLGRQALAEGSTTLGA
jgi:putative transposase